MRSPIFSCVGKFSGHEWVSHTEFLGFTFTPIFLGSENTAAAATSVIETEVLTWDVYSSMARSGLPNSGLGSDEVKAGTAADQRILGIAE